jgi:peroxiredoxin Q/BCP
MHAVAYASAMLLLTGMAVNRSAAEELKVGDKAPAFELKGSDGKTYKLSDLSGKHVVVAWFPKAFTGG